MSIDAEVVLGGAMHPCTASSGARPILAQWLEVPRSNLASCHRDEMRDDVDPSCDTPVMSLVAGRFRVPALLLALMAVACLGEDPSSTSSTTLDDGGVPDAADPRSPGDGGQQGDAGDGGTLPSFVVPSAIAVPLSQKGPDQLQSVAVGPDGAFYAAGFIAQTVDGPRTVVVAKLTATGALDTSWNGGGIAPTNLTFAGGNDEIDIAVQASGKIVVSATIPSTGNALDTDIGVTRLAANGATDAGFGQSNGIRRIDLNTAWDSGGGVLQTKDQARALALGADGSIHVHASTRSTEAPNRTDADFAIVKLDAEGAPISGFGASGTFRLPDAAGIGGAPRGIVVLPDGAVVASGYSALPNAGNKLQPVLYKVSSTGTLLATFHETVLAEQAEIYQVVLQGSRLVAVGYGRAAGETDWLALSFDAATLGRDSLYGGAPNGAVLFDVTKAQAADSCRSAVPLPNGKTLLVGAAGATAAHAMKAAFAVVTATGAVDTASYEGPHVLDFGGVGNDQLWSAAVSGDKVVAVGYRASLAQTENQNDDSFAIVLPIR